MTFVTVEPFDRPSADLVSLSYAQSVASRLDSSSCLIALFRLLGVPGSLLDVGCGSGHLVRIAAALGVSATGIDVSLPANDDGTRYSLRKANLFEIDRLPNAEMVLALEVAEHLPEEFADRFVDLLVGATANLLVFSAATPGQGGAGHVNEQPNSYWTAKFEARGLRYDASKTQKLRLRWSRVARAAWWYGKNAMLFRRRR